MPGRAEACRAAAVRHLGYDVHAGLLEDLSEVAREGRRPVEGTTAGPRRDWSGRNPESVRARGSPLPTTDDICCRFGLEHEQAARSPRPAGGQRPRPVAAESGVRRSDHPGNWARRPRIPAGTEPCVVFLTHSSKGRTGLHDVREDYLAADHYTSWNWHSDEPPAPRLSQPWRTVLSGAPVACCFSACDGEGYGWACPWTTSGRP